MKHSRRQIPAGDAHKSGREGISTTAQDRRVKTVAKQAARLGLLADDESLIRLYRILSRLESGSKVDLRTPFFTSRKGAKLAYKPRSIIIDNFRREIDWASSKSLPEGVVGVLQRWEEENRENIGPMSPYLPFSKDGPSKAAAVMSDKRPTPSFSPQAHKQALEKLRAVLVGDKIMKRISIHTAIEGIEDSTEEGMDTTTNSGLPFMLAGWKPSPAHDGLDNEYRMKAFNWYVGDAASIEAALRRSELPTDQLPSWYAVSGQRLVQKGPKPYSPKSKRLIQMMPKTEAIIAKTYTTPLQEQLKLAKNPGGALYFAAWYDLSVIDEQMQVVLRHAHEHNRVVLSGDISNFDATVPPFVLMDIGRVISAWFGGDKLALNSIKTMIYHTGLITPTMIYPPGVGSMRSGSGWTQVIGSLSNLYFQFYGEALGLYKIDNVCVLGDDFVLDGEGVNPKATAEVFSHFDMQAHPDKQFTETDMLQFLKRIHIHTIPGGIASAYRTLGSTLSLERMRFRPKEWSPYAYIIRALSQLQNATFNPLFETLVHYVQRGDKYALGSKMSVAELVGRAGNTGRKLLREEDRKSWKRQGTVTFENWSVNRVLRGDTLPPPGKERFQAVYGRSYGST